MLEWIAVIVVCIFLFIFIPLAPFLAIISVWIEHKVDKWHDDANW